MELKKARTEPVNAAGMETSDDIPAEELLCL